MDPRDETTAMAKRALRMGRDLLVREPAAEPPLARGGRTPLILEVLRTSGGVKFQLFSQEGASMKRENLLSRLLRALSGKSQERVAEEIGVHPSFIGQIEIGQPMTRQHLEHLARSAGITLGQAWEILEQYEVILWTPQREGRGVEILLDQLAAGV